jgi:phosphoglycerate kinase
MMKPFDALPPDTERALLRCDFNVPVANNTITDDHRIRASLPTINELLNAVEQVIITSHRGRPNGHDPDLSTAIIADHLRTLTDRTVHHVDDPLPSPDDIPDPDDAQIIVLENIRYVDGETSNASEVAEQLAALADIYVFDGFGVGHRQHSSTDAIQQYLPSHTGLNVEREQRVCDEILSESTDLHAIIGGAKLSTKIVVIDTLRTTATAIYLGGKMMLPFYAATGYNTGKTQIDEKHIDAAKDLVTDKIILPVDVAIGDSLDAGERRITPCDAIPDDALALDIGPDSVNNIFTGVENADYIVWNGPLGYYENDAFAAATKTVLHALAHHDAKVIIGGGDTGALVNQEDLTDSFYHVSTGGGAFLTLLETGSLPVLN